MPILKLRKLYPGHPDAGLADKLNNEAFPEEERVELSDLFDSAKSGRLEILGIYPNDDTFAGFIAVRTLGNIVYIAYFAVCPDKRSKGIGGKALHALAEYYGGKQIIVDFESIKEKNNNPGQRKRRRDFYMRNGFHETGWYMYYMDTEFEVACTGGLFEKESFENMIEEIHSFAPDSHPEMYRR